MREFLHPKVVVLAAVSFLAVAVVAVCGLWGCAGDTQSEAEPTFRYTGFSLGRKQAAVSKPSGETQSQADSQTFGYRGLSLPRKQVAGAAGAGEQEQGYEHVVQKGQSLSTIAKAYGVTVEQIKQANNLKSNLLYIGQKLFIPKPWYGSDTRQINAHAAEEERAIANLNDAYRLNPNLESLLVATESSVRVARSRNGLLVEAKNALLPKLLRESKSQELTALISKIERTILDLSHESEVAKDRAQQGVERGAGGVAEQRELSLAYRERIEVLKAILTPIKEELANRTK